MIINDLHPFSIVQDSGFRELLKELELSYILPSRPTFSKSLLPGKYDEKVLKLQEVLKNTQYVTLSTDGWTSINTEDYLAVTADFITIDWLNYGCLLSCFKYDDKHTAENIAEELRRVFNEWNIHNNVYAVTIDNASNVVAATTVAGFVHIPCFAHTTKLVVRDGLKLITEQQAKLKNRGTF